MIQIDGLVFSYGGRRIYDCLSLELEDGAVYGLLGRNGAGKTTLMRLVAGLLRCGDGRITVDGRVPSDRRPEFLDNVYFVPESFNAPDMPVAEYAGSYGMFYSNYDRDAMMDLLHAFEVDPQARFRRLSSGQKKKALIAFALSLNTRLLLLDEPGNGLDIPSKLCLRRMIAEYIRPDRIVVLSTHQVRDIDDIVDHVTVIDSGRLLLNSSIEGIAGKVTFEVCGEAMKEALFSDRTASGIINIVPRTVTGGCTSGNGMSEGGNTVLAGEDGSAQHRTGVDLEVLFNACIYGGGRLTEYFMSHDTKGRR